MRNLCVLNDGTKTFVHCYYRTATSIDLTVVDPSIVLDFEWSVLDDLHGSDHYPILLKSTLGEEEDREERYNIKKANWTLFDDNVRGRLKDESVFNEGTCPVESCRAVPGRSRIGLTLGKLRVVEVD